MTSNKTFSANTLFIGSAICFLYLTFVLQSASNTNNKSAYIDFASYYAGAKLTYTKNTSPYLQVAMDEYKGETGMNQIYPFVYPPPSLYIFYPLSLTNFENSKWIAYGANHILLVGIFIILLILIQKNFDFSNNIHLIFFALYFFNYDPIVSTFTIGQTNLILLFCISAVWLLTSEYTDSKITPITIGLLLSIAILLKLSPALLLVFFLLKKNYRVVSWTVGWTTAFCLLSAYFLPNDVWNDWINLMLPSGTESMSAGFPWNISLNGFFSRLFSANNWTRPVINLPWISSILTCITIAIILLVTFWKSYTAKTNNGSVSFNAEFGLYLFTMFLVSPISWGHHLAFTLPAVVISVGCLTMEETRIKTLGVVIVSAIILGLKIPYWHSIFYSSFLSWIVSIKMFAVIALWFYLLKKIQRK